MSKSVITDALLTGIADAIRTKTGSEASLTPAEMAAEIESISGGGSQGSTTPEELIDLLMFKSFADRHLSSKYPVIVPLVDFGLVTQIPESYFRYTSSGSSYSGFGLFTNVEKIICPHISSIEKNGMYNSWTSASASSAAALREAYFSVCGNFGSYACAQWFFVHKLLIDGAVTIGDHAFLSCGQRLSGVKTRLDINASIQTIGTAAFQNSGFEEVNFTDTGTPQSIASDAFNSAAIQDIYVPWSEGDVEGAPWGATSATIHYGFVTPAGERED